MFSRYHQLRECTGRAKRGKDGKQHQALHLEHTFPTSIIRINDRHKYMLPNPLDLIILHTSTNSQGSYVVAIHLPSEEKDEGMDSNGEQKLHLRD